MSTFHATPATVFDNGRDNLATGEFPFGIILIPTRDGTPTHLTIRDASIIGAHAGENGYALPGVLAHGDCSVTILDNVEIIGGAGAETLVTDRHVLNFTDSFACEAIKIIGGSLRIEGPNVTIQGGTGGVQHFELVGNNVRALPIQGAAGITAAQMTALFVGAGCSIRGGTAPPGFADGPDIAIYQTEQSSIRDMRMQTCRQH